MERLTRAEYISNPPSIKVANLPSYMGAYQRLAEYEDTGLEADEIRGLKEDIKYLKEKLKKQNHDLNYASDKIIKLLDDKCYWKREALKWANEIGEQRIGPLIWMDEERIKNERGK